MPVYCFTNKRTGQTIERMFHVEHVPAECRENGRTFKRDIPAEHRGFRSTPERLWPLKSDAAGCHPKQVDQFERFYRDNGCPTRFDRRTGQCIFTSAGHRRKALKLRQMHDKAAWV